MNAARISELIRYLPHESEYFPYQGPGQETDPEIARFVYAYRDLAFGFHFVRALVVAGMKLPLEVNEPEIRALYWWENGRHEHPGLKEALGLRHPMQSHVRKTLEALLVTEESLEDIAHVTGVSLDTLHLYSKLFWAVRDRREDALFLASVVYPHGRLEEKVEGYINSVDAGTMMLRAAWNNSSLDVGYFAGLRMKNIDAQSDPAILARELEGSIMANGLLLARNGFMDQRHGAHGLNSARGLLVAAKQGGDTTQATDPTQIAMGTALLDDLQELAQAGAEEEIRDLMEKENTES